MLLDWQLTQKGVKYYVNAHCSLKHHPELVPAYKGISTHINSFKSHYHFNATIIKYFLDRSFQYINGLRRIHLYQGVPMHIVILNIIRNPVDTILSSYNYHKKAPEIWIQVPLEDLPTLHTEYGEKWENICTYKIFANLTTLMGIDYVTNNVSVEILYNEILSEQQGIYFEFMRYSMCCWYEIWSSYEMMDDIINMNDNVAWIGEDYDWDVMHAKQFRLENFIIDFNKTCNEYLDVFGILEMEHRNNLMNRFQAWQYDGNDKKKMKKFAKAKHVTMGSYDKQKQIEYLLQIDLELKSEIAGMKLTSANARCNLLKQRTELLRYQWQYDNLC